MSFQPTKPTGNEWTTYATIMLLAIVLTAFATALQVPQSISEWIRSLRTPEAVVEKGVSPVTEPAVKPHPARQDVCGTWQSQTSQKHYNFVCRSEGLFEVYEVGNGVLIRAGSGKVNADGSVEADLVSPAKNRKGHWKLKLSPDGRIMQGPWYGDDPREFGQLTFYKA